MGKPFKLDTSGPPRAPDGKFTRPETPSPVEVRKRAEEESKTIFEAGADARAPDHPTPGGKRGVEEIPWPPAGPSTDANKKPFRVS